MTDLHCEIEKRYDDEDPTYELTEISEILK
jgi:hypothetical protein